MRRIKKKDLVYAARRVFDFADKKVNVILPDESMVDTSMPNSSHYAVFHLLGMLRHLYNDGSNDKIAFGRFGKVDSDNIIFIGNTQTNPEIEPFVDKFRYVVTDQHVYDTESNQEVASQGLYFGAVQVIENEGRKIWWIASYDQITEAGTLLAMLSSKAHLAIYSIPDEFTGLVKVNAKGHSIKDSTLMFEQEGYSVEVVVDDANDVNRVIFRPRMLEYFKTDPLLQLAPHKHFSPIGSKRLHSEDIVYLPIKSNKSDLNDWGAYAFIPGVFEGHIEAILEDIMGIWPNSDSMSHLHVPVLRKDYWKAHKLVNKLLEFKDGAEMHKSPSGHFVLNVIDVCEPKGSGDEFEEKASYHPFKREDHQRLLKYPETSLQINDFRFWNSGFKPMSYQLKWWLPEESNKIYNILVNSLILNAVSSSGPLLIAEGDKSPLELLKLRIPLRIGNTPMELEEIMANCSWYSK